MLSKWLANDPIRQNLLTFGYIRNNYDHEVPTEISMLCESFYNQILFITIDTDEITKKENDTKIYINETC